MRPGIETTLACYDGLPARARGHVRVRWRTCPFAPVEACLPAAGRILELGCGHGLFATYLAFSAAGRAVVGTDVAPDKLALAQAAARASGLGPRLEFRLATSGDVPPGPWDGVAVVDVLYLLDAAEQRRLVECAARELAPGGVLAVKEMATRPRWKRLWNLAQETLAVRVLGITHGRKLTFVAPEEMAGWMRGGGLEIREVPLHRGYLHPHHLLVGRRPT